MRLRIEREVEINVKAEKAWRVIAHSYGDIDQWAVMISKSNVITDKTSTGEDKVTGRVCSASGFGEVQETFTYFDEDDMRYGYEASKGLPFFIKRAENNWAVKSLGEERCLVESKAEVELNFLIGLVFGPIFYLMMGRKAAHLLEELKYFTENDKPHPRKVKYSKKEPLTS